MDKTPHVFVAPTQQQATQPTNTPSHAPKDKNPPPYKPKLTLVIPATLITILVFATGLYLLPKNDVQPAAVTKVAVKPKPKPTTKPEQQWKLFINGNFGYKITYPGDWHVKQLAFPDSKTIIDAQYFNDSIEVDYVKNRMSLVVTRDPIGKSLDFLNYNDKVTGFRNASEVATVSASGREITKALIVTSQFDPITKNYFETGRSYQILIPLGENTLTLHAKIEDKDIANKMLTSLTFMETPTPTAYPNKRR